MRCLEISLFLATCACDPAWAEVALPSLFKPGMVLQQGIKAPIWGWAKPGEAITVSMAGQTIQAIVGTDGRWQALFQPLAAGRSL